MLEESEYTLYLLDFFIGEKVFLGKNGSLLYN